MTSTAENLIKIQFLAGRGCYVHAQLHSLSFIFSQRGSSAELTSAPCLDTVLDETLDSLCDTVGHQTG